MWLLECYGGCQGVAMELLGLYEWLLECSYAAAKVLWGLRDCCYVAARVS